MTYIGFFLAAAIIGLITFTSRIQAIKWEVGRFIRTATYYNAFRFKLPLVSRLFETKSLPTRLTKGTTVWSSSLNSNLKWGPLDDVVMGGVSKSNLTPGDIFNGTWSGYVTTENNGGFAGIRTRVIVPAFDASACTGLILKLTGDGNRYKCILRDNEEWNGIAWSKSFDTAQGKSISVKIPFSDLIPTKFAKSVAISTPFNKSSLSAIQLTLSKFEYNGGLSPSFREGDFRLVLDSIETY